MVQIYEDEPSFASQMGAGLGKFVGDFGVGAINGSIAKRQKAIEDEKQAKSTRRAGELAGEDYSDLSPEMQKVAFENKLKVQQKQQEAFHKQIMEKQEKQQPLMGALNNIQRMRDLGATGHLGPKVSQYGGLGLLHPETRAHRAEYEQLGKSLISMASTIPIRNQMEFETLSAKLYDPTLTDATREGILDAMERIVRNSLEGDESQSSGFQQQPQAQKQESQSAIMNIGKKKPPLSSFHR